MAGFFSLFSRKKKSPEQNPKPEAQADVQQKNGAEAATAKTESTALSVTAAKDSFQAPLTDAYAPKEEVAASTAAEATAPEAATKAPAVPEGISPKDAVEPAAELMAKPAEVVVSVTDSDAAGEQSIGAAPLQETYAKVPQKQSKPADKDIADKDVIEKEELKADSELNADASVATVPDKPEIANDLSGKDSVAVDSKEVPPAKPVAALEATEVEQESFFSRLKKTRDNLASGFSALLKGRVIDDDLYEEIETSLLTADLGIETTNFVIEKLREEAKLRELHDASLLRRRLQQVLTDLLKPCEIPLDVTAAKPFVILMVGVNGAGKTTTIGKLARKYKDQGLKVMLAAGDTFRAAAVEQLKEWGRRVDAPVIAQPTGSDSASVLFDALTAAKARGMDVLICDTAGRLQNKSGLMEELKKIVRVLKKIDPEVPHEVLLVLDASTGQNAVSQTKIFKEAAQVSGLCLTKLDGTAKGGVIFALADKFKLPLRYVGLGEKAEDLRPFKADLFVKALLQQD